RFLGLATLSPLAAGATISAPMPFSCCRHFHRRSTMTKTLLTTVCALALSGSAALAQRHWMPPGPNTGPGGASGAAPTRDVGTQPNVGNTPSDATTSSSMTQQQIKEMNAGQRAP